MMEGDGRTRWFLGERGLRWLAALAGMLLCVAAGMAGLQRVGGRLVTLSYDLPFAVHRGGISDAIRIVYLDEVDGDALDRRKQAELLDRLGREGARAVLYDLVFDRESADPAVDEGFAEAMLRFRGVGGAGETQGNGRVVLLGCAVAPVEGTGVVGGRLVVPNDRLLAAADGFGLVAFAHDERFTVRSLAVGTVDEPSLSWQAAVALGAGLREEDRLRERWLNYGGPPVGYGDRTGGVFQSCLARDVLAGMPPGFFRDRVVLIGGKPGIFGAVAGQDLFATPFHRFDAGGELPLLPGVELHAHALANLLKGTWLERTGPSAEQWMVLVAGVLSGGVFGRLRPASGFVAAIAVVAGLAVAAVSWMHFGHRWFPWAVPAFVQVPLGLVWGTAGHFYIERHHRMQLTVERERIRQAFARYLSPQMLQRLSDEGFRMRIGGEKTMAAMMFTDIESFTEMCQRVADPERIVATLNDYFERTTGHIFQHDGIIIKFIGDAIFAAWGVPRTDPDAALKAARAAWRLSQSDSLTIDGVELRTRIGVHAGAVVAGNVGTEQHVDYTLIGDAVNLTARLEGLNRMLDTHVLLSDTVAAAAAAEFRTRLVGWFRVKGRSEITEVHELLGPAFQESEPEWLIAYRTALLDFAENNLSAAAQGFRAADALRGRTGDGPARFFLQLIPNRMPGSGGVVDLSEK